jgi:hypothetical protein
MRILLCLSLVAFSALTAAADVNVTGNWTGTFQEVAPGDQTHSALLVLKQDGSGITGSVGPDENERYQIRKGTIEGNKITLEIAEDEHSIVFELVLDGDRIYGDAHGKGDGGEEHRAKLDVKRAK